MDLLELPPTYSSFFLLACIVWIFSESMGLSSPSGSPSPGCTISCMDESSAGPSAQQFGKLFFAKIGGMTII